MNELLSHIYQITNANFTSIKLLSGGSISSAFVLKSNEHAYFLKVNSQSGAYDMFAAEQAGLKAIEDTKTIAVPKVLHADMFEGKAYLLMDFVESKSATSNDFKALGVQLAHLHLNHQDTFGFTSNNLIGSLPQSNTSHSNWPEFYWHERIAPQFRLALQNKHLRAHEIPSEQTGQSAFENILGNDMKPSLLHGDLWSGNYLIALDGTPYLIDPAIYFGHSMIDIAMSKLFGGFGSEFYSSYHEVIPKSYKYDEQIELYQLYFLLVHLNLFGSSYYTGVATIMERYF